MSQIVNSGARPTEMRQRDIQPQGMERAHSLERRIPIAPLPGQFHIHGRRFRLQSANSTRQIPPIIFSASAFAPSAPREIGEFSSAFSGAIAPIRQAQPPLDLTHVFWEGMNHRPPRRPIRPLGIEGNAPSPIRQLVGTMKFPAPD